MPIHSLGESTDSLTKISTAGLLLLNSISLGSYLEVKLSDATLIYGGVPLGRKTLSGIMPLGAQRGLKRTRASTRKLLYVYTHN